MNTNKGRYKVLFNLNQIATESSEVFAIGRPLQAVHILHGLDFVCLHSMFSGAFEKFVAMLAVICTENVER